MRDRERILTQGEKISYPPSKHMQIRLFPANERGHITWDWLDTYHSFSFGHFYNPLLMGFGTLRVINDDLIAPGQGFGKHSHANMEIITIPLSGAVEHEDNTGAHGVTPAGSVQVMSAGSFVAHSEFNASKTEPLSLFQIWIETKEIGIPARYDEKSFDPAKEKEDWQLIVSNDGRDGSLMIHQDAFLSLRSLTADQEVHYTPYDPHHGLYLMVIAGRIEIAEQTLGRRDAIGVTEAEKITLTAKEPSRLLLIEVPMKSREE